MVRINWFVSLIDQINQLINEIGDLQENTPLVLQPPVERVAILSIAKEPLVKVEIFSRQHIQGTTQLWANKLIKKQ